MILMNILITGSEGLIGKIILKELKKKYKITKIDTKLDIDILKYNIFPYFQNIDTIIHLAANPNPFISKQEASKNLKIVKKVISAGDSSKNLKRIINASSINVYQYINLFEKKERLTKDTALSSNTFFGDGSYGRVKIESEKLFKEYCKQRKISLINLRLGCVTSNNLPNKQFNGQIENIDYEIHLKHKDLIKIIKKSLFIKGIQNYVCVSKKDGFIDKSINFPI